MLHYDINNFEDDNMHFNSPNNNSHGSFSEISSSSTNDKVFKTSPKVTFYIDIASVILVIYGLYELACYLF